MNTEIKGTYNDASITSYVHGWNISNYEVFVDTSGNTYARIRQDKNLNNVVYTVLDIFGNTINISSFDFLIKQ
jgi:hypothetical protein